MLTIQLKDIRLQAYHGVYPQEKILGGTFVVNVQVQYLPDVGVVTDLGETLNYETLFNMIRERMAVATPLLEQVAMELTGNIMDQFPSAMVATVSIEKCHPPIEKLEGSVVVTHQRKR
ncbi:MAG TPA: dihydroneopterin aldolase [Phnomibacter sp.]|nr:dihydroneopterin aldolase [Phnomibacter sp.]